MQNSNLAQPCTTAESDYNNALAVQSAFFNWKDIKDLFVFKSTKT